MLRLGLVLLFVALASPVPCRAELPSAETAEAERRVEVTEEPLIEPQQDDPEPGAAASAPADADEKAQEPAEDEDADAEPVEAEDAGEADPAGAAVEVDAADTEPADAEAEAQPVAVEPETETEAGVEADGDTPSEEGPQDVAQPGSTLAEESPAATEAPAEGPTTVAAAAGASAFSPADLLQEVLLPPDSTPARVQKLEQMLIVGGASAEQLIRQTVRGAPERTHNVIVTIPGSESAAGCFIVGAHTDTFRGSSGAIDNWSGVVMLAALHAHFRQHPLRRDLKIIGFGSEEHGGLGSRQFVRTASTTELGRVVAFVNLECLGVDSVRVWRNQSSDVLEEVLARVAQEENLTLQRQFLFGYTSDAESFRQRGLAAITVHSLPPEKFYWINSDLDVAGRIDAERYQASFRLLKAYLVALDGHIGAIAAEDAEQDARPLVSSLPEMAQTDHQFGVRLAGPPRGSPEADAGLREGDRVTHVNGIPVENRASLCSVLQTLCGPGELNLKVERSQEDYILLVDLKIAY